MFDMLLFEIYCLVNASCGKFSILGPQSKQLLKQLSEFKNDALDRSGHAKNWMARDGKNHQVFHYGFLMGYAWEFMGYARVTHGFSGFCGFTVFVRVCFVQGFRCSYGFPTGFYGVPSRFIWVPAFSPFQIHYII